MRGRACVYQQTNQNIAPVQWSKIFKTTDGVGQNQSSFRGAQAYFKDFSWDIHNFFKWTAYRKPYWKCLVKYSAHFVAYFFFYPLRSSNTDNIFAQLVAQHCCVASWKASLPVLPPSLSTCHATNFDVASCGNMLRKVDLSSTFCNKLSILWFASQLATLHNTCDWSIFRTKNAGKMVSKRALDLGHIWAGSKHGRGCGGWECWNPRLWIY